MRLRIRRHGRRVVVLTVAVASLLALVAAACGGGDDPTPTTGAPTATSPAPTATSPLPPGETRVAPTPTPTTPPRPAWEVEWEALIAAATEEGNVVINVSRATYRTGTQAFNMAFPDINMEFQVGSGSAATVRWITEHEAGIHNLDMVIGASTGVDRVLTPYAANTGLQILGDTRAALEIRPDVGGDENWIGSLEDGFLDKPTNRHIFTWWGDVGSTELFIDKELAASGFSSYNDLFKPELKGKWCMLNPVTEGSGAGMITTMQMAYGTDFVRRLLETNPPLLSTDPNSLVREMIDGRKLFCQGSYMEEFWMEGLGLNVERWLPGALPIHEEFQGRGILSNCCGTGSGKAELDGFWSSGSGGPAIIGISPNPNAAALVTAYLSTREGSIEYIRPHGFNKTCSRRADLQDQEFCDIPENEKLVEGNSYVATDRSDTVWLEGITTEFVQDLFGGR